MRRTVEWFKEKFTDLFRPWHNNGLPDELAFGEIEAWRFVRGAMGRAAFLSDGSDVKYGVFEVIGLEYVRRAARTMWPHERLLMEDVSCAFEAIETRAQSGGLVPRIHQDRLVFLLERYLAHVGTPWTREQLREAVERYLATCSRDVSQ